MHWLIGLDTKAPFLVWTADSPSRLVIDIESAGCALRCRVGGSVREAASDGSSACFGPCSNCGSGRCSRLLTWRVSLQFHDPNRSLGAEYFARFRDMCTASPARANPYLQLFTMGEVVCPEARPAFLTRQGATVLRSDPGAVRFVGADITRHLATEAKGADDNQDAAGS